MSKKKKVSNVRLLDGLVLLLVCLCLYVIWDLQGDLTHLEARVDKLDVPRMSRSSNSNDYPYVATHLISGHFCSREHSGDVVFFDSTGKVTTWSTAESLANIDEEEPSGSGTYNVEGSVLKMKLDMKDGSKEAHRFNVHKITRFDGIVSIIGNSDLGVFSKEHCKLD